MHAQYICINPYAPKPRGMSDIYSVAFYLYFGGTFKMALLASSCFCLNVDDLIHRMLLP